MNKQDIQQRVLQNGKPLDLDKFEWDEETKTFSSKENNLVLDFSDLSYCTFNTGYGCTFKAGDNCSFDTGYDCTFKTGYDCTFKTGDNCTFNTGDNCSFDTGDNCTFKTGGGCVATRRDVFEIIEIPVSKTIKLNGYKIKGYVVV